MDLLPDIEQSQIIEAVRQFLSVELPLQRLQGESAVDDHRCWPAMAALGWFGIGLQEDLGGAGMTVVEEMLLCIEAGRHLVSPALVATLLGAHLAARAGDEQLGKRIAGGEAAVALVFPAGPLEQGEHAVSGRCHSIGATPEGSPLSTDYLLLAAPGICSLLPASAAQSCSPLACIDGTLSFHQVDFAGAPPLVSIDGEAGAELYRRGSFLTAALATGMAATLRDLSVAYAGEREQFGRPIGSFQAIKHYCADMAVRCEAALALTTQAGLELAGELPASDFDVPAAKLLAVDAAIRNAEQAIQIHGAMGFTRELPLHSFLKRAHVLGALFGDERSLLAAIGAQQTPA